MSNVKSRAGQARRRKRTDYAQQDALVRKDLISIWRHWTGRDTLSHDAIGELFLHGLLLKRLPATQVLELAPWARLLGADHYIDKANDEPRKPTADMLGDLIEFYFEDLKAMKRAGYSVRHIAPNDAHRSDVDKFWEDEKRKADRERKQLVREQSKEQRMPALTKRAKAVYDVLRKTHWTNVNAIMKAADLRNQRNRRLAPDVARVAVHRALKELVQHGIIEIKSEIGKHGMVVRFARRSHVCGQVSVIGNIAIDNKETSAHVANPIKPGTSRTSERRYFNLSAHLLTDRPTDTPTAEAKSLSAMEVLDGSPPSQPTSHPLEEEVLLAQEELAQHVERLRVEAELNDQSKRRSNR